MTMATAADGRGHGHIHIHGGHEHDHIIRLQFWYGLIRSGNGYGHSLPREERRRRTRVRGRRKEAVGKKETYHLCGGGCFQLSRTCLRRGKRSRMNKHFLWQAVRAAEVEAFAVPFSILLCRDDGGRRAGSRLLPYETSTNPTISDHFFHVLSHGSNLNSACCVFVVGLQPFRKSKYRYFV